MIGRPPADPLEASTPLITDRPVLLLAGGVDPITPPWMAEAVKAQLPNAAYVLAPWVGHGVARSDDCVGVTIMPAFLKNPTAAPDATCVAEMKPPNFVLDFKQTGGVLALYNAYQDGAVVGPAVWLGASLATLAFATLAFPLGLVARTIDRRPAISAGGARWAAIAAAASGLVGAGVVGWAAAGTLSEHVLLAPIGLAGPAQIGAWLILAGAVAGIAALALAIYAAVRKRPPIGTILGAALTSAAAVSLAGFAAVYGLL